MPTLIDDIISLISSYFSRIYELIISVKVFPSSFDPGILLAVVFISYIGILMLLRLVSRADRRRYNKIFRSSLFFGSLLGILAPWNLDLGLTAAVLLSLSLLALAVSYVLPRSKKAFFHRLSKARERVRDSFLYLSVTTGVAGIISTLLTIFSPALLGITLSPLVPLSLDAISVLASLMEFTIPLPDFVFLNGLIMSRISKNNGGRPDSDFCVKSAELDQLVRGSRFMVSDLVDAFRLLCQDGFASVERGRKGEELAYRVNGEGVRFLESCHDLVKIRLEYEKQEIDRLLSQAEVREYFDSRSVDLARRALKRVKIRLRSTIKDNYPVLDREWYDHTENRLNWDLGRLGPPKPTKP